MPNRRTMLLGAFAATGASLSACKGGGARVGLIFGDIVAQLKRLPGSGSGKELARAGMKGAVEAAGYEAARYTLRRGLAKLNVSVEMAHYVSLSESSGRSINLIDAPDGIGVELRLQFQNTSDKFIPAQRYEVSAIDYTTGRATRLRRGYVEFPPRTSINDVEMIGVGKINGVSAFHLKLNVPDEFGGVPYETITDAYVDPTRKDLIAQLT
jgi:hypothetical protein